jgi:hypothetical protein
MRNREAREINAGSDMKCSCGTSHPWDAFTVASKWAPAKLQCLIVGESPGDRTSVYMYDQRRRVAIRTILLRELARHRLIDEATLPAFRESGFLFDHGIRCLLPKEVIDEEWRLAKQYRSPRASSAIHLRGSLDAAPRVWIMGYIARNAVVSQCPEIPRPEGDLGKPPYPQSLPAAQRFFVSRYLLRASTRDVAAIFRRLHSFLEEDAATQCAICSTV